jgi:SNF2 family DNA or RNA helicase/uncharacterized Zn finger protein
LAKIKYGQTVAGKKWYESLENNFGLDGRFVRGKSYFSKGYVKKFGFMGNRVFSKVKGTYSNYDVGFSLYTDKHKIEQIISYFTNDLHAQASILNGEISEDFFTWSREKDIDLCLDLKRTVIDFRFKDIPNYEAYCDCYDFYDSNSPCKHILALMFALAQEIDHNPLILLKLNGIEPEMILNTEELDNEVPYPIDISYSEEQKNKNIKPTTHPIEILHYEDMLPFFLSLMQSNTPFAPIDYKEVLKEFYKFNSQKLSQVLTPIHDEDIAKIERVFKESKIEIVADKTLRNNKAIIKHPLFKQEETLYKLLEPYIIDSNSLGCSISILNFTRLFLSFKSDNGGAYYRYFYQLCRIGYLLLNSNGFLPSVIKEKSKSRFFIAWIPFLSSTLNEQFEIMKENMISCVRHSQKGPFFESICGSKMFLASLFSDYVFSLDFMHKRMQKNPPEISLSFFKGNSYTQKGAGKHNTDKAVANAFSIFMLSKNIYTLEAELKLDKNNSYNISFYTHKDGEKELFCDEIKKDNSKELLKLISPITLYLPQIKTLFAKKELTLSKEEFEEFILKNASILNSLGVRITLPRELHNLLKPKLAISAKSNAPINSFLNLSSILEYDWTIAIGEHNLSIEEFKALVKEQGSLIEYKNNFILIDPNEINSLFLKASKKPKLSSLEFLREKFANNLFFDKNLEEFFNNLFKPHSVKIPKNLNSNLREYQKRGFEWGVSNLLNGFGVILADDMGLGKTIQTISIILYLYENKHAKNKSLIVVPTSLLNNWQVELSKFAPTLNYMLYYGQNRVLKDTQLVITTYDTLKRDETLKSEKFDVIVIDEAQKIKNSKTQAALSVKSIKAKYKIALSGTPVENSLTELWSIFDFTLKGYLGEISQFINYYAKPIEIEKNVAVAENLQKITSPFMIRRLKSDKNIINDLPDKIIIDEYASMMPKQAALYQNIVDTTLEKLKNSELKERSGLVFKLITELKQICNHPKNFDKISDAQSELSGKTAMLLELLEPIISRGEKVLIFTQYVQMAQILFEIIEKELLIEPLILDGSLSKKAREEVVSKFETTNEYPIFILSLKAGGVGLNLTSASNVIHYDLWFNPAVENQATDRAFRIGQKRNVFVYRFITKNSFEEKIDNMIKSKLALGEMSVAVGEKNIANMSDEEIKNLMKTDF